ncbi:iron-containing alcohol dehydrogenase [Clostridium felsineum]|uniref:iron-containing alcohol dehydrogenase n=1 Tax=Clostridium felsineum TaxID=36839 RepID=UPI004032CB84
MKAAAVVKKENIDFILAVGGGSVIDETKLILLASYYEEDAIDLLKYGMPPVPVDVVPFGNVLTLPATGSEMNCSAVITHEHVKYVMASVLAYPKFSLVEPTIIFTLPKTQVANGVVDAFVHVAEQYLTYPVDARVQDRMEEGILQTLIEVGETTVNEFENYDVRANHVWSATMSNFSDYITSIIRCKT